MKLGVLSISILFITSIFAQSEPKWDNSKEEKWPNECKKVIILSSLDGEKQSAFFYSSTTENSPLIISLHTWSGSYKQNDKLAIDCIKKNYNYIHPDFRGPNNTFKACGSKYVIQDIEDAIAFAIKNGKVDINNIHVIGTSGGGYATLLTYMNTNYPIKTFSAWVPISNLVNWYYESVGRKNKYARDIVLSTNVVSGKYEDISINEIEAKERSPFFMKTPVKKRSESKLFIYAGIHDGYQGSVPITQSLHFFNKVINDYDSTEIDSKVSNKEIIRLLESRNSEYGHSIELPHGAVHLQKQYLGKLQVTIFEGGHEMLLPQALSHLKSEKILAIGDSNGSNKNGWVNQLKKIRFNDFIYNTSIPGNTLGFDNGGPSRNTVKNAGKYLSSASDNLKGLDKIIIMLGTNDCKAIFNDSLKKVPQNMRKLLRSIKSHEVFKKYTPVIIVISPPPGSVDHILKPKYYGMASDIAWLQSRFMKIATEEGCKYIDVYSKLLPHWEGITRDGIHLKTEGYQLLAKMINQQL